MITKYDIDVELKIYILDNLYEMIKISEDYDEDLEFKKLFDSPDCKVSIDFYISRLIKYGEIYEEAIFKQACLYIKNFVEKYKYRITKSILFKLYGVYFYISGLLNGDFFYNKRFTITLLGLHSVDYLDMMMMYLMLDKPIVFFGK